MRTAIPIACIIGLALAPFAAHAQSADLVLCDRVAAAPDDPDKPKDMPGVPAIAPSDIAIALKYCKTAAASSRRAMYELGRAHATSKQMPEAIAAWRRAADKGSTAAMVELGVLYANGAGVAKDEAQARKLFERAAQAGNPLGVSNLAAMSGSGGPAADPAKARAMLTKAAEANSPEAEYQLGMMMADGSGGAKDETGARALFEKAAAQNHPGALLLMGVFAESGRGGPKDESAAKSYYKRSADLGNDEAKAALKRLDCPYVVKDKRGTVVTNLCF
jgi:TPR repeat protein